MPEILNFFRHILILGFNNFIDLKFFTCCIQSWDKIVRFPKIQDDAPILLISLWIHLEFGKFEHFYLRFGFCEANNFRQKFSKKKKKTKEKGILEKFLVDVKKLGF